MKRNVLPRAVIFDFDGVILESGDIKTEAFLELFADYPEHRQAILRYHLDNIGISRYRKFDWIYTHLFRMPLDSRQSEHLGRAFSDIALGKILACAYVPGALECLKSLYSRSMLFIASGTPQEELDLIVDRRGLRRYFSGVFGTPLTKPDIIRLLLTQYDLSCDEVVFVGDGLSDYQAASETGLSFIARESASATIDWSPLGVPIVPDLQALPALLGVNRFHDHQR
jgi:phosphoglycolate phosphatase-like HAD superfamily hydrolase